MSMRSHAALLGRRDVSVKRNHGVGRRWAVRCVNCQVTATANDWHAAVWFANNHARTCR